MLQLNQSQLAAEQQIKQWLLGPEKFFVLSGASGYGKSFLTDHIVAELSNYNKLRQMLGSNKIYTAHSTATTNKAASVLRGGQTFHKLFKFRPKQDYDTGETTLIATDKSQCMDNSLILVDEASCLNTDSKQLIDKYTGQSSKVLFTGDHAQLKPVGEKVSPVFDDPTIKQARLTVPVRQAEDSYLFQVCQQLRDTVETGIWKPILPGEGVSFTNKQASHQVIGNWFHEDMPINEAKIITFTNARSIQLNHHVRQVCGFNANWQVGDWVAIRNFCFTTNNEDKASAEATGIITEINPVEQTYKGLGYHLIHIDGREFRVPASMQRYKDALQVTARPGSWKYHFYLKEQFADLRSAYSCTGHVSQGSTYDKVFIDLTDMGKCYDADTLARLVYVATSRARKEVVFHGQLPTQYRG